MMFFYKSPIQRSYEVNFFQINIFQFFQVINLLIYFNQIVCQNVIVSHIYNKINLSANILSSSSSNMKLHLCYRNQTRSYNKLLTIKSLINFCQQSFESLPENFSLIYQSSKGEMTYIESDADLIGLKLINSLSNNSLVKLTILRSSKVDEFDIDEDIETMNLVRENIEQIEQNVFNKLEDETESEAISDYLNETYEKVSLQIATLQNSLILQDARQYLTNLYDKCVGSALEVNNSSTAERPKAIKKVRFSIEKPATYKQENTYRSQKSIDKIVSEKVLQLIPSLVDKIYSKLQSKVSKKCKNCLQKQIQLEQAIDQQISKRISFSLDNENPEQ